MMKGKTWRIGVCILLGIALIAIGAGCASKPTASPGVSPSPTVHATTEPQATSAAPENPPTASAGTSPTAGALTFNPGTYTAEAEGYGGPIKVEVVVNDTQIQDVKVVSHKETQDVGTKAVDQLPKQIVDKQTLNLDAVAGATVSSKAILKAASDALAQSGVDLKALGAPQP